MDPFLLSGAGSKNRTRDLLITNQLLYQLSYAGAWMIDGAIIGRWRRGDKRPARKTGLILARAGRAVPQQHVFLAVFLDDGAGAAPGRQADVDKKHGRVPHARRDIGRQVQ